MNIVAIRAALGTAPTNLPAVLGKKLTCLPYLPNSVTVPTFYPAEVELHYADRRNTFNGIPVLDAICQVLTAEMANDVGGQQLLDAYLSHPASTSIKAALETDQTLGGLCASVFVHDVDGYRMYQVNQQPYFGARFHIQILGGV